MATQSFEQLIAGANKIKTNELPESNTASLVGEQLIQMVNKQSEEHSERTAAISKEQSDRAAAIKAEQDARIKGTTEYNVSVQHPTGGISGTNKYTLETAIQKIPAELRTVGIKCSFLTEDNSVQTYVYQGGVFDNQYNWSTTASKINSLSSCLGYIDGSYIASNKQWKRLDYIQIKKGDNFIVDINTDIEWSRIVIGYNGSIDKRIYDDKTPKLYFKHLFSATEDIHQLDLYLEVNSPTLVNWNVETGVALKTLDVFSLKPFIEESLNNSIHRNIEYKAEDILVKKGFVNWGSGELSFGGYITSDFISVREGFTIETKLLQASSTVAHISVYSQKNESSYIQNKSIQGEISESSYKYIVDKGVEYVRISANTESIEKGIIIIHSEPAFIDKKNVSENLYDTSDKIATIGSLNTIIQGDIYGQEILTVEGSFIYKTTGALNSHPDFRCSDFIKINKGGRKIIARFDADNNACVGFYDSSRVYLNQFLQQSAKDGFIEHPIPDGAAFVRFSNRMNSISNPSYKIADTEYDDLKSLSYRMSKVEEFEDTLAPLRLYPQTKLPCLSFQFDDIPDKDSVIYDLFISKGLTCAFAFIGSEQNIKTKGELYRNYQRKGFAIMNHSVDGKVFDKTNYNSDTARAAIVTSKNNIERIGMICNGFVSPSSSMDPEFMPIIKANHCYAFTSSTRIPTSNGREQDRCDLHRYSIESNDIQTIKTYIDNCISNDQIVTLYGHAANIKEGDTTIFSLAKIGEIIDYCIAKRDRNELFLGNTDDCVKYYFDL